jgi:hypothetical protein
MGGIFISKGITPVIKPGDLVISLNEKGELDMKVKMSMHFNICPTWLKLSIDHLEQAREWSLKRKDAWAQTDNNLKSETLEREFEHSMQAIIAMAIAYDSFYASIKSKIDIPKDLSEKWKINRTARHIQVTETIRLGFKIKNEGTKILKQSIKEIFRFRDMAVHPKSSIEQAITHPELGVGVEWRFAYFTYENAKLIINEGLKRFREITQIKVRRNTQLDAYRSGLLKSTEQEIARYESNIGLIA